MSFFQTLFTSILQIGLKQLSRSRLPQITGRLRLPGLNSPVEILRDRWGVPHIYASNLHDLLFAQGFVHAQDRLWQMDFQRRVAAGRLAEVLGPEAVPVDRWLRILGLRRAAERDEAMLDPQTRELLEAYCAGVNAQIAKGPLPIEFTLLHYRPAPWTPADTLSWAKMIGWGLSINWETELLRAQLIARLGPARAAELEPVYPPQPLTIVPPGVNYSPALGRSALERAAASRPFMGPPPTAGLGSNNWAVAGWRTTSGKPLLANDMHLPINIPSIWYENHLVEREAPAGEEVWHVTGVTFPGTPGVIAGHNGHVAWGFTNGFPDVQDLYMEHLRRTEDGRVQYEYRGEWLDAEVYREEIRVRGEKTVVQEVIVTRHGPIINELAPELAGETPLALRWTGLEPDTAVQVLLAINRAHNCREFHEALRYWTTPVQNVVYADVEGTIAYSLAGKIPIRARGDGQVPVPGWTGEYEWVGYIPFEELPHFENPPQGYIATANNPVVGDDYPYFISREYCTLDRAQRICELLEAQPVLDLNYMCRMQFDQVSPTARRIAGHLSRLTASDPDLKAVVEMMTHWDGQLAADSPAAAVHEIFMRRLIMLLLRDKLGELPPGSGRPLVERYAGHGPTPMIAEASFFSQRAWEWVQSVLEQPESPWFDLGHGESREDVLRMALEETIAYLRKVLGPPSEWAWGKLHTLNCRHTLGRGPALARLLNRGPYPMGGDTTTIWATGANCEGPDGPGTVGPPFRFVADLSDLPHSLALLAPGQSGHPASPHYDDQLQAWFRAGYHPMLYQREEVEESTVARLELVPAN
jgi:penicillin amidase